MLGLSPVQPSRLRAMFRMASPAKKNAAKSDASGKNLDIRTPPPTKIDPIRMAVNSWGNCITAPRSSLSSLACMTLVEEMVAHPGFCFGIGPSRPVGPFIEHYALPTVHWLGCSLGSSISCPLRYGGSTRTQHCRSLNPPGHASWHPVRTLRGALRDPGDRSVRDRRHRLSALPPLHGERRRSIEAEECDLDPCPAQPPPAINVR